MIKAHELSVWSSCLNTANHNDWIFVLLSRDPAASWAVRCWCLLRVLLRKNHWRDPKIREAWECARQMDIQRKNPRYYQP